MGSKPLLQHTLKIGRKTEGVYVIEIILTIPLCATLFLQLFKLQPQAKMRSSESDISLSDFE